MINQVRPHMRGALLLSATLEFPLVAVPHPFSASGFDETDDLTTEFPVCGQQDGRRCLAKRVNFCFYVKNKKAMFSIALEIRIKAWSKNPSIS
jgi:hypothetical protein